MQWYLKGLKKYAGFRGRATRMEFWLFMLICIIINLALEFLVRVEHYSTLFTDLYSFAIFLPSTAVLLRRLHDTGKSSWWALIFFVPVVGPAILLLFLCQDSQEKENVYGPNPKSLGL